MAETREAEKKKKSVLADEEDIEEKLQALIRSAEGMGVTASIWNKATQRLNPLSEIKGGG